MSGWWESFVSESGMLRPVSSVTGYFYRLKRDMFEKDSRCHAFYIYIKRNQWPRLVL